MFSLNFQEKYLKQNEEIFCVDKKGTIMFTKKEEIVT